MGSTFSGIELGKRGLMAHSQALQTVGHNMANSSTEGYSRQRVEFRTMNPLYDPALNREERPGQIGQGVNVASIQRIRDGLLEGRIVSQGHSEGYWSTRERYMLSLEQVYNEPYDISVRGKMDRFWESWQDLSMNPQDLASRHGVIQRGEALMDGIHQRFTSLRDLAQMSNEEVAVAVGEVNNLLNDITALNNRIERVEALGDNPNDLLDRRDLLVERLSAYLPVTTEGRDPDEFRVHTGGIHLIQGNVASPLRLEADPENNGYWQIYRGDSPTELARISGGRVGSLMELRDGDIRQEIQKLDVLTVNFIDLTNEIHRSAYSLNGEQGLNFFQEYPFTLNVDGSYDRSGDGVLDSTYLFRVTGRHGLDAQEQVGLAGTLTLPGPDGNQNINYFPTDTVGDIINRINNSGAEVVARLDREGRMEIKATTAADLQQPDFVIRSLEDSGQFLVGYTGILAQSGPAGAYNWEDPQAVSVLAPGGDGNHYAVSPLGNPSAWIGMNPQIAADPTRIAASFAPPGGTAEQGNGDGALAIASLRNSQIMMGRSRTFDDYFAESVAEIGLKGEVAQSSLETQETLMRDLRNMRESISGVNMDEEMANMLKFQHGYNAVARFISEWNKMLDTVLNRMGV